MAKAKPTATSLDALAAQRIIVSLFHSGQSPAGHHWTIEDEAGTTLLLGKRVHSGNPLARAAWKTVTLVGMDAGNDLHLELLGADKTVLAKASTINEKPPTVTISDPHGLTIARSVRDGNELTVFGADDARHLATLTLEGDQAWPVFAPGDVKIGELLAGAPGPSTVPTWTEILLPVAPTNSADLARTMHLGVRRVMRYAFQPEPGGPAAPPALRLLPLLAALSY